MGPRHPRLTYDKSDAVLRSRLLPIPLSAQGFFLFVFFPSSAAAMASSRGAGGTGSSAAQGYFCHQCEATVSLTPSPTSDLACPICHGGFVEELEAPPPAPSSYPNPSPIPFFSFPDSFSQSQLPFVVSASSSGGPPAAAALSLDDVIGAFAGPVAPRSSPAPDNFDALSNTLQFVLSRLHDLTSEGAQIQFIIENHPSGSFGDYFVGPGLEQLIQQLAENDPNRYGTPPASKSAVEALPEIKVTGELLASDEAQCAVCKDTFEVGTDVKQMPCKHIYHKECILPWLELHNSCPVCRYELPTDDPEYEHRMRGAPLPPATQPMAGDDYSGRAGSGAGAGAGAVPRESGSPGARSGERNMRISLPWSIRALFGVGGGGRDGGSDAGPGAGDANSSDRGGQHS
ncbi:hypothetical protein Taro_041451 [Colocasia esculenta]|uniref:RING-type E3 ubiquitin transferase n=1 Tax=Colocasia esculenta TaxID=4460 RepID=A0A843WXB8_COLES|nr:hypothetical protein [Colocasia esculenta]